MVDGIDCEFSLPDAGCIDEGAVLGAFQASGCTAAIGAVLTAGLGEVQEWRCASADHAATPTEAFHLSSDPPSWPDFATHHLLYPLLFQVVLSGLSVIFFKTGYDLLMDKCPTFSWFVYRFIGSGFKGKKKPTSPIFPSTIYLLQIPASAIGAALFFLRLERQARVRGLNGEDQLETVITVYFIINYLFLRLRDGYSVRSSWGIGSLIDVFTIVPVIFTWMGVNSELEMMVHGKTWLSLDYLRAWRCLQALRNIERQIGLEMFSELHIKIVFAVFKMLALVIVMGGTICLLEVLGEVPGFEDKTLGQEIGIDDGGNWSGLVMIYYVFITISTVGYGDYSPTTFSSRLCSCVFIVCGIFFFNAELEKISTFRTELSTGKGKFVAQDGKEGEHIVVLGTGVGKSSSTMEAFLSELLDRQNDKYVAPDVVLLSEEPFDTALCDFVQTALPQNMVNKVFLLVGSAMNPQDLERVALKTTKMAFVIPDIMAQDTALEDGQNLVRALHMRNFAPGLRLRLMLLEPESRKRAVNVGIKAERCLSAHEMKANFMVQASRVRGFLPLVSGLFQVTPQHEVEKAKDLAEHGDKEWMEQYLWGLQWTVYGLVIHEDFEKKSFSEAAAQIYKKSEGQVLLIAALDMKGRLMLNYPDNLAEGQVVMAMASSSFQLAEFEAAESDWRKKLSNKRQARRRSERDGTHGVVRVSVESRRRRVVKDTYELRPLVQAGRRGRDTVLRLGHLSSLSGLFPRETPMSPAELLQNPRTVALVVAGEPLWPEVLAFLEGLSGQHVPRPLPPVCVLCSQTPPMEVASKFQGKDVVFLSGPVINTGNLVRAGIHQAHSIVVFRGVSSSAAAAEASNGEGITRSHLLSDDKTIMLASTIEQIIDNSGDSLDGLPRQAVYEFASTQSVHLVERSAKELERDVGDESLWGGSGSSASKSSNSVMKGSFRKQRGGSNVSHARSAGMQALNQKVLRPIGLYAAQVLSKLFASEDEFGLKQEKLRDQFVMGRLVFHKLFAAGQIFTSEFYGKALGHIFVFPATIELSEAMGAPDRSGQTSFTWQVKCPQTWVGEKYFDLVVNWLGGGWAKDAPGPALSDDEAVGCAVILGLYRANPMIRGGGFNMTMPGPEIGLHTSDFITVLADAAFGRRMSVVPDAGS